MQAVKRYQLKLAIDAALKSYGASAVSWVTGFSNLVIRKYDHPYSADRSCIGEWFIVDEADWLKQRESIVAELEALPQKDVEYQDTQHYMEHHYLGGE